MHSFIHFDFFSLIRHRRPNVAPTLSHLLLRILQFLLLPLGHQVVQPAQLPLGEHEVEQLADEHQRQDLKRQSDGVTAALLISVHLFF